MRRARGFECHVTFSRGDAFPVKLLAGFGAMRPGDQPAWKYSQIDGDPVLGDAVYCYLSAWDMSYDRLQERMGLLVDAALDRGLRPLRTKIEAVVYDVRW